MSKTCLELSMLGLWWDRVGWAKWQKPLGVTSHPSGPLKEGSVSQRLQSQLTTHAMCVEATPAGCCPTSVCIEGDLAAITLFICQNTHAWKVFCWSCWDVFFPDPLQHCWLTLLSNLLMWLTYMKDCAIKEWFVDWILTTFGYLQCASSPWLVPELTFCPCFMYP